MAFKDRTVKYNFIGAPEWMPQMQEVFAEWQNEIMQRQAYQYQQSQHVSGPTPPPPPQWKWNQYPQTPSSGYSSPMTPSTPLPAYSTPVTSPLSSCNQYGAAPPSQKPMPTQPMLPRSTSTDVSTEDSKAGYSLTCNRRNDVRYSNATLSHPLREPW